MFGIIIDYKDDFLTESYSTGFWAAKVKQPVLQSHHQHTHFLFLKKKKKLHLGRGIYYRHNLTPLQINK